MSILSEIFSKYYDIETTLCLSEQLLDVSITVTVVQQDEVISNYCGNRISGKVKVR